jgi:hypothetical protein
LVFPFFVQPLPNSFRASNLDPSYFNTFAAILKWRHKLFFGIYLQIPEAIRTEKARFQKKVSRETPRTGLPPHKRIASFEGLMLSPSVGQRLMPQEGMLGEGLPQSPQALGSPGAGRPPARDGLAHQRDKWDVGDSFAMTYPGRFLLDAS